MKTKENLINSIIKKYRYKSYLEIGTQSGVCFEQIKCNVKVGVDPAPSYFDFVHVMTSDNFFKANQMKFDLIFIDGLHHADQVIKDFYNSLKILNTAGTIVLHDMMPTSEASQRVPRETKEWYGDCWKVGYHLRYMWNNDFNLTFHKYDCGILEVQPIDRIGFLASIKRAENEISQMTFEKDFDNYIKMT